MKDKPSSRGTHKSGTGERTRIHSLAHDINNALSSCIGAVQSLIHNTPEDSTNMKRLNLLLRGIKHSSELVNAIYDDDGDEPNEPISLSEVVENICNIFHQGLSIPTTLNIQLDPEVYVQASRAELKRMLLNLLVNAEHATGENGEISVSLINQSDSRTATIEVSDNGSGMTQETLHRLEQGSFSTKTNTQRSGHGLVTVKNIVKKYKGDLQIHSKLGEGSTFTITLPLASQNLSSSNETVIFENSHILLVDPDENLHATLRPFLQDASINITSFANFELAYDWYEQHAKSIAVVFLYAKQENEQVLEWFPRFQSINPSCPVLISSPTCTEALSEATGKEGLHNIPWPMNYPEISKKLMEILGTQSPLSSRESGSTPSSNSSG